jgi:hypothetical protein
MNSAIAADKADLAFALFVASLAFLSWVVKIGMDIATSTPAEYALPNIDVFPY